MFRMTIIAALCLVLASCIIRAYPPYTSKEREEGAGEPAKRHNEASSSEKDAVRLTVRVPKAVHAGTPFPVHVEVVNIGKNLVLINWETAEPMKVEVKVTTKDGKEVPFTLYGRKMIAPTELIDRLNKGDGSIRGLKVKPGKGRDLSVPNLGLFYDLTLPGEYALTVSRSFQIGDGPKSKDVDLQVEKIPFTINRP